MSATIRYKTTSVPKFGSLSFSAPQMRSLGVTLENSMKERIARAVSVFDSPMAPLSEKYKRRKLRFHKQPVRDLNFSGQMLQSAGIIDFSKEQVTIGIQGAEAQKKAILRIRQGDAFWGPSPLDGRKVDDQFLEINRRNIDKVFK